MSNSDDSSLIQYKSPVGIAKYMADALKNKVLNTDERLTETPATFVSILTSNLAELGAVSFYEANFFKRECNLNTAILYRTLFRNLLNDDLALVFGQPAKTTFFLGYQVQELLDYAIPDETISTIKRLRINKDCVFTIFGQQTFVLDHSIDIEIVNPDSPNPTFKATFDTSDKYTASLSDINNNLLNVRKYRYKQMDYVVFDIPARQYKREYKEIIINSEETSDIKLEYSNNLMGFEVLYKLYTNENWRVLTGTPEGLTPGNYGYNYELSNVGNSKGIIIRFGKNTGDFKPALRSTLKIIVYTTTGSKGNMSFPNLAKEPTGLAFSYLQDKDNDYEMALTKLRSIIGTRSISSTGGRDQMSFEEIRSYIISRKNSSEIITDSSLKRKASEYGFSTENTRHDVLGINYRLSQYLKDSDDNYISSGYGKFLFYFDDLILRSEMKARLIKPSHVFTLNKSNGVYYYTKNPDSYKDYVTKYKNNSEIQVSFPYFLKIEATDVFRLKVFDLSANQTYFTEVEESLTAVLDNISINNILIYRNPSAEKVIVDGTDNDGIYIIRFTATASANTITALKNDPENAFLKFRLSFHSKDERLEYWCDAIIDINDDGSLAINEENQTIQVSATLTTSNNINDSDNLCITNYSLRPFPTDSISNTQYWIDLIMDMRIHIMFQSEAFSVYKNDTYDKYLTRNELNNHWYVGTVYKVPDIVFGKNLTQTFGFVGDINIVESKYDIHTTKEYKTYTEDVYAYDSQNNLIMEDKKFIGVDGSETTIQVPKLLHRKGEYKLDLEGNKILAHDIGDAKYDENGDLITLMGNKYYCQIEDVLFFNRIYNVNNKYFDIIGSYEEMISNIESLRNVVVKGIVLNLGVKSSSGESKNYYYHDMKDDKYKNLDNIAISIKFGAKFPNEMTKDDIESNKEKMISLTQDYMKNQVTTRFTVGDLFTYLKQEIPSIVGLVHYSINNYDALTTQIIEKKLNVNSVDDEILCFKFDVDTENSSFEENRESIVFKPAITIIDIP